MIVVILVGGLGTRLRSVISTLPKPMAPIEQKPFLAYLLEYLKKQGVSQVVFAVCHLSETIRAYFTHEYAGIKISYAEENTLLGTGGAMVNALRALKINEPIFIVNGDTFLKLNYSAMFQYHSARRASVTVALSSVADCSRYGKVILDKDSIVGFHEKGIGGPGLINAGVYLLDPNLFNEFDLPCKFSFERDFLRPHITILKPLAWYVNDYFIDIGVPEDYARIQRELPTVLT